MYLQKLALLHFKNYDEAEFEFLPGVNCFTGRNGAGKTNVLDALHYLAYTKSCFNLVDSQNIQHQALMMMIQGQFEEEGSLSTVTCAMKRNGKKVLKKNAKEYERLADHIGQYPLVMIQPADIALVQEGSEERRRLLDMTLSQTDSQYLNDLLTYNKALENRNRQLRLMDQQGGNPDRDLLLMWERTMCDCGQRIYQKRKAFAGLFSASFNEFYRHISGDSEQVSVLYESQLHESSMEELFERFLSKDIVLQRSSTGVHKDDVSFSMGGYPLKRYGSQGQQKSFVIALRLAQYTYLQQELGKKPLLLLDDIFEKIDDRRAAFLLQMIRDERFGQVFITDTHEQKLREIFASDRGVKFFRIEEGNVLNLAE